MTDCRNMIDVLNEMHEDLVSPSPCPFDSTDKIIRVLEVLADRIADLENHSHSIN